MKRTSKKNIKKSTSQKEESHPKGSTNGFFQNNLKYVFLLLVIFSILIELYFAFYSKLPTENNLLLELRKLLIIPTIIIGSISIWFEKEKLSQIINELFTKKQNTLLTNIKTSFNGKQLVLSLLFLLVLGISVFTLFYKLDNFDLYSDEITVVRGASGYNETGEFKQWDFIKGETVGKAYNRAKPHQFITALSLKIFGTNAWSARFPSALFSVLLIIFIYFFGVFFIKDKQAVLLTAFSLALFFQFLTLGRWARMYAMVFPAFLLTFYWTFSFLTQTNNYKLFNSEKKPLLNQYFNFNYIVLPFLFLLLYINLFTHQNSALVFPVFLLFSVFSVFIFHKEKKYITASVITIGILLIQIISPFKVGFSRFTFFEVNHSEHYSDILFGFPFSFNVTIVFLVIGLFIFFLIKNTSFRKSYLALFITGILTWILFSYIFNYPSHYRYVSFVTPLIILLIIALFSLINKVLFSKPIQLFLTFLLIVSVSIQFVNNYESLYVTNKLSPAKPSIAYKSISDNYKEGDVVFRHWGPKMYMKGIASETEFISLGSYEGRSFAELYDELLKNKSGWITWHSQNSGRIDKQFQSYVNLYLKKYNGHGIDKTGVEVFYYSKNKLVPLEQFFAQQYLPTANLSSDNSYSLSFMVENYQNSGGIPFSIKNDSLPILECLITNDSIKISTINNETIAAKLYDKTNSVVWYQKYEKGKLKHGLTLNEKIEDEKEFNPKAELYKFQINPAYRGNVDKVRLYDFVLNEKQIEIIRIDDKENISSEVIEVQNKEFRTLYLWQRR